MKGAKGGRARALLTLDKMLAKHANQSLLAVELQKDFRENPVRFFKTIIMPLLPHEARLAVEQSGVVGWKSLVGDAGQTQDGLLGARAAAIQEVVPGETAGLPPLRYSSRKISTVMDGNMPMNAASEPWHLDPTRVVSPTTKPPAKGKVRRWQGKPQHRNCHRDIIHRGVYGHGVRRHPGQRHATTGTPPEG